MKITLTRSHIEDAIALGSASLARFANVGGRYNNQFNSHVKGRFGEIAMDTLFVDAGYKTKPHYRTDDTVCDLLVLGDVPYPRLEVKTWSPEHWDELGRCVQVGQLPKIERVADAVVWYVVDLPKLRSASDLNDTETLVVEVVGFSLPSDVREAPVVPTRFKNGREVTNHQVAVDQLRAPNLLLIS